MQIAVAILIANANSGISYVKKLIKSFKARVIADSGIFEAEACLYATLTNLNNIELLRKASLIITPNAYEASKLYSVVPNTTLGDMTVVRATTATRVNSAGLIESVAINVPRLDYTNGSCPSILVEPQRTNLLTYSENFSNVIWTKAQSVITSNVTTAPDGILNASRLTGTGINGQHNINQFLSFTISSIYTFTSYVKIDTNNFVQLVFPAPAFGTNAFANFDLLNGVLGTVGASASASINNVGDGWFRCSVTATATITATTTVFIALVTSATSARLEINTLSTSLYLWGTQLEVGSYKTSYIPTVASTVTRNADFISKTGISSLIGQTEGTIFAESFVKLGQASMAFWIRKLSGGFYGDFLNLIVNSSGVAIFEGNNAGTNVCFIFNGVQLTEGYHKFAIVYKTNYFALFIDGVKIGEDLIGIPPSCDELYIDQYIDGGIRNVPKKSVILFKTALTDAECIELTTL